MKNSSILRRYFVLTFFLCCLAVRFSFGWGSRAHEIINRVAFEMLPGEIPAFLHTRQALDEVEYLGPEPDRWRSPAEPELSASQAPEHFLDLEPADLAAPDGLPAERFDFIRDLDRARRKYPSLAAELTPQKVGLLPWEADEMFERLRLDMRDYRTCLAGHQPTRSVQQAILYDAGLLGHYVADGSQPLHTTTDYNGWVEAKNPEGFTRQALTSTPSSRRNLWRAISGPKISGRWFLSAFACLTFRFRISSIIFAHPTGRSRSYTGSKRMAALMAAEPRNPADLSRKEWQPEQPCCAIWSTRPGCKARSLSRSGATVLPRNKAISR